MKETTSESEWVGKIITCTVCQRSYEIEAGDVLTRGGMHYHKRSLCKWSTHFKMPCGHNWNLPNAGAVPRRGSDVGTSPLLAVSESGDK